MVKTKNNQVLIISGNQYEMWFEEDGKIEVVEVK